MLSLPASVRIFLACAPVDCRKGFDGLHGIVRDQFLEDPLSGHLFVFFNRRKDRVKVLAWDRNGFAIFYKRLERGTFEVPRAGAGGARHQEIERARLQILLEGITFLGMRYRNHFGETISLRERTRAQDARPGPAPRRRSRAEAGAAAARAALVGAGVGAC